MAPSPRNTLFTVDLLGEALMRLVIIVACVVAAALVGLFVLILELAGITLLGFAGIDTALYGSYEEALVVPKSAAAVALFYLMVIVAADAIEGGC